MLFDLQSCSPPSKALPLPAPASSRPHFECAHSTSWHPRCAPPASSTAHKDSHSRCIASLQSAFSSPNAAAISLSAFTAASNAASCCAPEPLFVPGHASNSKLACSSSSSPASPFPFSCATALGRCVPLALFVVVLVRSSRVVICPRVVARSLRCCGSPVFDCLLFALKRAMSSGGKKSAR